MYGNWLLSPHFIKESAFPARFLSYTINHQPRLFITYLNLLSFDTSLIKYLSTVLGQFTSNKMFHLIHITSILSGLALTALFSTFIANAQYIPRDIYTRNAYPEAEAGAFAQGHVNHGYLSARDEDFLSDIALRDADEAANALLRLQARSPRRCPHRDCRGICERKPGQSLWTCWSCHRTC